MRGRCEIGYTLSASDPSFAGRYGKVVCTSTDETVAFIVRTRDRGEFDEHETNKFDLLMMGTYTVWTVPTDQENEVDLALEFDLVPVVHVEDLAYICLTDEPYHDLYDYAGVYYEEYVL